MFIKTISLSAVSTVIRVSCWLLISKIVAVSMGPAGFALLGQVQNFLSVAAHLLTGGSSNGIVKLLASSDSDVDGYRYISAALIVSFAIYAVMIPILVWQREYFKTLLFFETISAGNLAGVLVFCAPFLALFTIILAVLNGQRKMELYFGLGLFNAFVSLLLVCFGAFFFNDTLPLLVLFFSYVVSVVFVLLCLLKTNVRRVVRSISRPNRESFHSIFRLSGMSLVAAVVAPSTVMIIRSILISSEGLDVAGIWDALLKFSEAYLMLFAVPMAAYFLPSFSAAKTVEALRKELLKGCGFVVLCFPVVAAFILLAKEWLIILLYTEDFLVISPLLFYQLIADFFKMISFLLGYLMMAKEQVKLFVVSDIFSVLLYIFLAKIFLVEHGVLGVVFASIIAYFCYSLFVILAMKRQLMVNIQ